MFKYLFLKYLFLNIKIINYHILYIYAKNNENNNSIYIILSSVHRGIRIQNI